MKTFVIFHHPKRNQKTWYLGVEEGNVWETIGQLRVAWQGSCGKELLQKKRREEDVVLEMLKEIQEQASARMAALS